MLFLSVVVVVGRCKRVHYRAGKVVLDRIREITVGSSVDASVELNIDIFSTRFCSEAAIARMRSLISDCGDVFKAGDAFWLARKSVQPFKYCTTS